MVGDRQQEVAFEGKVSPEGPLWQLMKWKVFSLCQKFISIRDVTSMGRHFYSWGLSLLPLPALMEAVQVNLCCCCSICFSCPFSAEDKAEYFMGLQFPLYASYALQPPDAVCI